MLGALIVILIIVAAIVFWAISSYNGLVRARREVDNSFGQIDVQLKRRYDLIPNLVETVKGYMRHEQDTLEKVISARNRAVSATGVHDKGVAEADVQRALNGVFALSEAYPELRSNENMLSLQEELKSTENKVAFARQYYNDAVTSYNTRIETFPNSLWASGFKPKELFVIENEVEREAVKVSF
ncbi:LemA family protein [bacterium]|nr:MAG: LemA family protein [bacterium]